MLLPPIPLMRARDFAILIGSFLLVGTAGLIWWNQETQAIERPPGAPAGPEAPPVAAVASRQDPATATTGDWQGEHGPAVAVEAPTARRRDSGSATEGIIRGDIQLAVSVLDRIESITVVVEEARSAIVRGEVQGIRRKYVPIERGPGTPTFEVRMPFSEYPYVVSVFSPGLNGSRRTITLDAEHAVVDDIVLAITPGSPFSVLVRDQDAAPYPDVDLVLVAVGDPAGRPTRKATTDNYGSALFEDLLAGDYQLTANSGGQPLLEPQTIAVQPGLRSYGTKVQGQGHQLTVPRGIAVGLLVHDAPGYGIADAQVTATALDSIKLKTVAAPPTDGAGRTSFQHLQPGRWQITIEKQGHARVDRPLTLTAGQETQFLDVRLFPARR
ncbi:MAG: carboxypeptidase-like regulatory domain-containing protein [Planctomycetes bacterium]|nr:carboxypeptidase-like regulatory domain-containing protein [Planctomycetota bacterium]MCC7398711.1 carboxypeptidase regulatory-like domain-containing protein [Planctomycetota bacterium]